MPEKLAVLYRQVMQSHVCPYGLKTRYLLRRAGYQVDDHWLTSRQETTEFEEREGVDSTPQVWINGKRLGGYDNVRRLLGKTDTKVSSYRPVLVVFAIALLLALGAGIAAFGTVMTLQVVQWFLAFLVTLLAMLKLQDVEAFTNRFISYDLLAQRWVPYAYLYPYGEALVGLLMAAGIVTAVSIPLAVFMGGVGTVSVFKSVYLEKRQLTCACVGGGGKVPLGFISLVENVAMFAMGIWMLIDLA
jgi:glutaredoxin